MLKGFMDRRSHEEAIRREGRLPPGQSLTEKFPVLHFGEIPQYGDMSTWNFRVFGLVEDEKRWSWEEFNKLPRTKVVLDLHCVTRWSKFDMPWEGVHLKTLIDGGFIKLKPNVTHCIQHCEYGYTTNLPVEAMLSGNFLLATHYDGHPLEAEHGYPLRGLMGAVPHQRQESDRYLWKGGKWLRGLEFLDHDEPGFWEQAGYSNSAKIWDEERYARRGW
ncbi:MAG TPA: molybdopterin-dependent oxidoreductase [Aggregatilineales bacterium]|nr:molybdopterin-dependent oxidoreductase [Aggregatilineales bacterium]